MTCEGHSNPVDFEADWSKFMAFRSEILGKIMAKLVLSFSVRRFIIAIIHLNRKAYDKITGRRWRM
ncbi:MAG: hypothetical protein ACLR9K_06930, partial [Blautia sp.]